MVIIWLIKFINLFELRVGEWRDYIKGGRTSFHCRVDRLFLICWSSPSQLSFFGPQCGLQSRTEACFASQLQETTWRWIFVSFGIFCLWPWKREMYSFPCFTHIFFTGNDIATVFVATLPCEGILKIFFIWRLWIQICCLKYLFLGSGLCPSRCLKFELTS